MIALFLFLLALSPLSEANTALERGDYDTAIRAYRLYLKKHPSSYEARFGLARALAFSGRRGEAIEVYTDLLTTHPDDPDARLGRGRVYAWEKRFQEAEEDLRSVTERFPTYADAWSALGDLYIWSGRPESAAAAYTAWVDLRPQEPAPYLARAKAHIAARRFSLAREDLFFARANGGDEKVIDGLLRELARAPAATLWEASLIYAFKSFLRDRAPWHTFTASIRRKFSRGSLALEGIRTRRFSKWDEAAALDGYLDLWPGAYGNLRFQVTADADVLPRTDYMIEVFQGFGKGWEVSGNYRHMNFPEDRVDIYGVSLAKYIGNWFLRERTTFAPATDGFGFSQSFFVRRFLGRVDDLLEIGGGWGREVVTIGPGPRTETRRNYFVAFRAQKFFLRWLGVSMAGTYSGEEKAPDGLGLSLGIVVRW